MDRDVSTAKPSDLSSVLGTHVIKENTSSEIHTPMLQSVDNGAIYKMYSNSVNIFNSNVNI